MSNIDKQALRERYSLQPVPKCHICDTVMTIARASAGAVMYACSGCTYDDNGAHYAPGRSLGDDHYLASRVTIFESGDPDVLALLDELEAAEERYEDMLRQARSFREAHDNAAEIIRKLERNKPTVMLPTTRLWAGKVACYEECEIREILRAAGIGVKGE